MPAGLYAFGTILRRHLSPSVATTFFDDKIGRYSNCALPSVGSPLATLHRCASAVSVAVQALQNAKLKICEQAPVFNLRLLHLRCATAVALGLIAALAWLTQYRTENLVSLRKLGNLEKLSLNSLISLISL